MLASVDWQVVWERLFHPDNVFIRALWTTVYIAVAAQVLGVVLGLVANILYIAAAVMLFKPDAKEWLGEGRDPDDIEAPRV